MPFPRAVGSALGRLVLLATMFGGQLACKSSTAPVLPAAARLGLRVQPSVAAGSGMALAQQPVVQVEDGVGQPVADQGRLVVAVLATVGGTLSGTVQVRTDAQGRATFTDLALAGPAGERVLQFDSQGLTSVASGAIAVRAGTAASVALLTGNLQTAVAGGDVPIAPAVLVTDGSGNPVADVPLAFTVTAGGGSVAGGTTVTDGAGRAAPSRWTLGSAVGLNTLTASSAALPGAAIVFTATGTLGAPALLAITAGEGQSATIGTPPAITPAALLTDALGHPLANVAIGFSVTAGGGSITGGTPLTNAAGIATLGSWILGILPGPNILTVSRSGVPSITVQATGIDFPLLNIDPGTDHTCGTTPAGAGYCWGANGSGRIGNGTTLDSRLPAPVSGGLLFTAISAGASHSCGLVANGSAFCWGNNGSGQLGDGTLVSHNVPAAVGGGFVFTAILTGQSHTCGLSGDGSARCWGAGQLGQLGDGAQANRTLPSLVAGAHVFTALSVGSTHSCGLEGGGGLLCWGSNANGRLGDGTAVNRPVPTPVSGAVSYVAVAASDSHTCAIAVGGAGYCWGNGAVGLLGNGTTTSQSVPTPITGGFLFASISSDGGHSCALTPVGQAYCWGFNGSGELGDATFTNRLSPVAVSGGLVFSAIRAGAEHTCGLGSAGSAYCWGKNLLGALGDGTLVARSSPVGVVRP